MAGKNLVILIGNLTKDPEVRYTNAGAAVCGFTIAVNESWTDRSGEKQEKVEFIRIVTWKGLAEACGNHLRKGNLAYVEGKLQTRKWQGKEGQDRYTTEINAQTVLFLSGSKGGGAGAPREEPDDSWLPPDDKIPF